MILVKILQNFLLPSVFIPIFISAGLVLSLRFKKQKVGKTLIIGGLICYYLFAIAPVADFILRPLETQYQQVDPERLLSVKKIVLLLGAGENNILRSSEVLRLYTSRPDFQIIISGLNPFNSKEKEAEGTKEYLSERGIPAEKIILEDKSRNTFESARNVKELIGEEIFFLVTSAYHMPRSMEIFQKVGAHPIPAPTDFKIKNSYHFLDFFPDSNNLEKTDLAFHEYFGILFYRLIY